MKYTYQARDRQGKVSTGEVDAESEQQVRSHLHSAGLTALSVKAGSKEKKKRRKRVKMKDLAVFARQFSVMINSGLSLLRALSILVEQVENATLGDTLRIVKNDVEGGAALSAAFAKHPDIFPVLMVNMTKAGEVGGFLDSTMTQIAENYEAEVRLRGKIKAALTYPVVVFILAILMCIAMLIFVVPTFKNMFANLGGTLPLPTRILVFLSEQMKYMVPLGIIGLVGFVIWWRKNGKSEKVRNVIDPLKLRLPVFGVLFQKIAIARFSRNFGTLLSSGVPILQSLDIVADTTGSIVIARALRQVQQSVKEGDSISKPLPQHEVFPPMVVQMITVGEDTGALDQMLAKIAEFYDQEVESMTESLTALIEPLMIAFLGGVVGSMIVALYMPIFKIFNLVN